MHTTKRPGEALPTAGWLEDAYHALLRAMEACRAARADAQRGDDTSGDLASSLLQLAHHLGVARSVTTQAMRRAGIGGAW